jgi:hypothetical protein
MNNCYADVKDSIGANAHEHVVAKNAGQQSQTLSGPRKSPSSGSINRPWSGRLHHNCSPTNIGDASYKGKEKVGEPLGMPNISAGYSHVDGEHPIPPSSIVAQMDQVVDLDSLATWARIIVERAALFRRVMPMAMENLSLHNIETPYDMHTHEVAVINLR